MQVPFLVHDEVRIGESVGIIEYLGRVYPNESLFPTKDHEACAINCKHIAEFHQKLEPLNIFNAIVWENKTKEQIGQDHFEELYKELDVWEEYLADENDYFLGDTISTSDIIVYPVIACFFWLFGLSEKRYPFLASWYHRIRDRPSVSNLEFWQQFTPKPEWRVLDAPGSSE
jgi:glutathione S-transferase